MNLWTEIEKLPRDSALTIAARLLAKHRPSPRALASAAGLSENTVRGWIQSGRAFAGAKR